MFRQRQATFYVLNYIELTLIYISYLDAPPSIQDFSNELYQKIDQAELSKEKAEHLKIILSIAQHSHQLWAKDIFLESTEQLNASNDSISLSEINHNPL